MRTLTAGLALLFLNAFAVSGAAAGPALLFDPADGKVLYAEDADDQWHPASLTKIMTAYLAFEALKTGKLKPDTKLVCSEQAFIQQPSKVGLPVGAELTVEVGLQALIVKSANDVAVMLAEAIAGSEPQFVAMMNEKARALGMTRTTFVNANGLPAVQQMTTARDLAKLARAVVKDYPEYAPLWAQSDMRFGKRRLGSHNGLLKTFEGADGLKTGFICDSGFNVVASATRDGHKLMAVVLGELTGAERTIRAASLLEHGFQNYGWKTLFNTTSIDNMPIGPDAKGITSMRQSVVSWECGTGRARVAAKINKVKAKAAKAKAKAKEAAAAAKGEQPAGAKQDAVATGSVTKQAPAAKSSVQAPAVKAQPAPNVPPAVAKAKAAPAASNATSAPATKTP